MTANGTIQLLFYLVVLLALAKPLGDYMARVYEGRPFGLDRVLGWRACGPARRWDGRLTRSPC
jgi:K+-transporting ATPase A subunit